MLPLLVKYIFLHYITCNMKITYCFVPCPLSLNRCDNNCRRSLFIFCKLLIDRVTFMLIYFLLQVKFAIQYMRRAILKKAKFDIMDLNTIKVLLLSILHKLVVIRFIVKFCCYVNLNSSICVSLLKLFKRVYFI